MARLLYPTLLLVVLTCIILLVTVRVRTAAMRRGEVPISYFKMMQGDDVPEMVTRTSRHFSNLFRMPVLYPYRRPAVYRLGSCCISPGKGGQFPVSRVWTFVAARIVRTLIPPGYNKVLHRLIVFGFGNLCLPAMGTAIVAGVE